VLVVETFSTPMSLEKTTIHIISCMTATSKKIYSVRFIK